MAQIEALSYGPVSDRGRVTMVTRRSFVRQIGGLTVATPFLTEVALAQAARAHAPPGADIVWLDANENPAGPPASAIEAIRRNAGAVGRYHMEEIDTFAAAIAAEESVKPEHVLIGVGSSDVITAAICAFASDSKPMITAAPSYDIVVNLARKLGRKVVEIPLTKEWAYPVKDLAAAAQQAGGGLIYLCNPNNPTSSLTSAEDIHWLATNLPQNTVLFVDEAYLEFVEPGAARTAMRYVQEGRDVIVSRTFSKIFGMAGARAGFGCARTELIVAMTDFMDNIIPVLGMRAARAALDEKSTLVPRRRRDNARVRGELCQWLRSKGISYIEPHANFVLIDVGKGVKAFGEAMRGKGVAVGREFPLVPTMLRVTVGTDADMARFRDAFTQLRTA